MKRNRNAVISRQVRSSRRNRLSDLNIRPIMNLFMLLVPALLLSATFIQIAVLHSAITEQSGRTSDELRPGLILEIDADGYNLVSKTCDLRRLLDKNEKAAGNSKIRLNGHDNLQLNGLLRTIKSFFPQEKELTMLPLRNISYQVVIATMDTVREFREGNVIKALFPNVAFLKPEEVKKP